MVAAKADPSLRFGMSEALARAPFGRSGFACSRATACHQDQLRCAAPIPPPGPNSDQRWGPSSKSIRQCRRAKLPLSVQLRCQRHWFGRPCTSWRNQVPNDRSARQCRCARDLCRSHRKFDTPRQVGQTRLASAPAPISDRVPGKGY